MHDYKCAPCRTRPAPPEAVCKREALTSAIRHQLQSVVGAELTQLDVEEQTVRQQTESVALGRAKLNEDLNELQKNSQKAGATYKQRKDKIEHADRELRLFREQGEQCAIRLERLRTDKVACEKRRTSAEAGPAKEVAERESELRVRFQILRNART